MIFGVYSVPYIISQYNTETGRSKMQSNVVWYLFGFILWCTALIMLFYYWDKIDILSKTIGLIGLLANVWGPFLTIAVVSISIALHEK